MTQASQAASRDTPRLDLIKDRDAAVAEVVRVAQANPLVTLSTVTAHGWPMVAAMHFSIHPAPQPLVYMFTHEGTRKLANIAANPRISLAFTALDERGEERIALLMRAHCQIVTSPQEHANAMDEHCRRPGYGHTQYLTLQYQPVLRATVTRATLFRPDGDVVVEFQAASVAEESE